MRGATNTLFTDEWYSREFQSTRPMRGATREGLLLVRHVGISIHAPHAGRDRTHEIHRAREAQFQSTRPMRGATWKPMC